MKAPSAVKPPRKARDLGMEQLEARNQELTRTLQIIEEARARLADHYDFAPIGFITLDSAGYVREINLTACRLLGRERPTLLDMPFFTRVAPSHCRVFLNHLRDCNRLDSEVVCDVVLCTPEGREIPVELRSVPVPDPRSGETVYRTAITDITERLRLGQAQRESEERYRSLVELLPDGIFIQSEEAIVYASSAAVRICGVGSAKELDGSKLCEWVRPAYRQRMLDMLAQAAAGHHSPALELQFLRRDGTTIDVEVAASAFSQDGKPAVLVCARDISRRKEAERHVVAIIERERMRFGRDLHDSLLQTLAGATLMLELLHHRLSKISPEYSVEAKRIEGIVRQSAVDARNLARGLCPVNIGKVGLAATLEELAADVTDRSEISCVLECDAMPPIVDVTVATHAYRIVQEAVANAIKHSGAESILIQLRAFNERITLSIADDGKGITADPPKTDETGIGPKDGPGMGMHTMRYRATIIGGDLEVRRRSPRGTMVTCTFPRPVDPL